MPGWADATRRRSRGRLRRSSAPPPPSPSLRGAGDHAVQGLAAPELQAMLSLGAARLESTIHALDESKRRARLQQAQERREAAVLLIQSHWRGGLRRRIVQEMQWAATIVQANARSHSQCRVFQLKRLSVLGIQVILFPFPLCRTKGEFSPLGSLAGCFLALGSGLRLVGTASARR